MSEEIKPETKLAKLLENATNINELKEDEYSKSIELIIETEIECLTSCEENENVTTDDKSKIGEHLT